jgi:phenylalanyl-tRNA synthetase alpha chain
LDIRAIVDGLSVHEKKVLLALRGLKEADVGDIEKRTGLDHAAVMRASLGLAQKDLIRLSGTAQPISALTDEGRTYAAEGLPERRMLEALAKYGSATADAVAGRAGLTREQEQISLGWLRRKGWVDFIKKDGRTVLVITKSGEEALSKKLADELLLERLAEVEGIAVDELPDDLRAALGTLKDRGLVSLERKIRRRLTLTDLGNQALAVGFEMVEEVSQLTHDLLVTGRWREVKFRRYDVTAPGAPIYPGKIHPQQLVIDELREILLEMGFVEIKSNLVESEFWNFDALFQAQDHPAREIHAALSLSKPSRTKLPPPKLLKRVVEAHERGVAGSRGWGYKFNLDISSRPVMCSQTTAATVRYLASRPKPPVKVFCIERVYRHDKIDYKHLAEFYQVEGIVMNPGLTLRDMLGYLKQILTKIGMPKIRFRPGYFPFTEPSVEADAYFPDKGEWMEVLGAGMFRPELVRPLGIRYPVLAWGIGFGRLAMIRLGIEDIRDLYNFDLEWLKSKRVV